MVALGTILLFLGCGTPAEVAQPPDEASQTCARSFGSLKRAVEKAATQQGRDAPPLPDKDEFVQICRTLSVGQAKCLDPVWAAADAEVCTKEMEAIPKATLEKIQTLMANAAANAQPAPGGDGAAATTGEPAEPDAGAADAVRKAMEAGK